jgi:hypothetical protein
MSMVRRVKTRDEEKDEVVIHDCERAVDTATGDDDEAKNTLDEVRVMSKAETMQQAWANDYYQVDGEKESIESEDDVGYVLQCKVKRTGKAVFIDDDNPPWRVALSPDYPFRQEWVDSMVKELREQLMMNAFTVIPRSKVPEGSLILRSNWRLLRKRTPDGVATRYKSRGYLAGYSQRRFEHYDEVTSPTVRPATLRIMLGHAAKFGLVTRNFDISLAFLASELDFFLVFHMYPMAHELIPDVIPCDGLVAEANKAIYGTRQGSRLFWKKLAKTLKELGFQISRGDSCLWYKAVGLDGKVIDDYDIRDQWDEGANERPVGEGTGERDGVQVTYVVTFVDDLCTTSSSEKGIQDLFEGLKKTFKIRDEGPLEAFLGCKIQRNRLGHIHLSQPDKCRKAAIAAGVDMETRKAVKVPSKGALTKPDTPREDMSEEDQRVVDSIDYRAFVGLALHIYVFSRPDIGYAINQLASHSNDPRRVHVEAAKQLGRYLADTAEMGICYDGGGCETVQVYCDADFADCVDTRRSISGLVIVMYGGAVSWTCRKQASVALSTMEAEAVSMRVGFCEVIGVKWDMEVFDPQLGEMAWPLHEDNQSLIAVVEKIDGGKYEARKHIAVRVAWLREVVATGIISVAYIDTADQVADAMTKALPQKEFEKHRASMMNLPGVDKLAS